MAASPFLEQAFQNADYLVDRFGHVLSRIPGSRVAMRYIKSSHQNDPIRTVLEIMLVFFIIRYLISERYSIDQNKVLLSEEEIAELVDEWQPEPLVEPLTEHEKNDLASIPIIAGSAGPEAILDDGSTVTVLSSYNFLNLSSDPRLKEHAVQTLRQYGTGACGPPMFYGTFDVHIKAESDISAFLGMEAAILYAQSFTTITSVIPAFAKRGDIIVADKGSNFAIQKGIQISRCTVRWYEHNDLDDLERVFESVQREYPAKGRRLTRRFVISEGLFENYGDIVDLPRLVQLKTQYKYRLILDETWSFSVLGKHGRGVTEMLSVSPQDIDMLVGSLSTSISAAGGFCAGSREVIDHQHLSGLGYVFSAALPPIMATTTSFGLKYLQSPECVSALARLRKYTELAHSILDTNRYMKSPSDDRSPILHLRIRANIAIKLGIEKYESQDEILQDIVREARARGVIITRARQIVSQEAFRTPPRIRICLSVGLDEQKLARALHIVHASVNYLFNRRMQS